MAGDAELSLPLTRIAEIRSLTRQAADQARQVKVCGVVTWMNSQREFTVQDDTGGIWVYLSPEASRGSQAGLEAPAVELREACEVEIEGVTKAAGYAPIIEPTAIRVLGPKPLPAPRVLDRFRFFSGVESGQRLEMRGVVLGFQPIDVGWTLRVQSESDTVFVTCSRQAVPEPQALLDSEVLLRGVAGSGFNTRGEFLSARLQVSVPGDIVVETPAPLSAFALPLVPLERLMGFRQQPEKPHRVRIQAVVSFVLPGRGFYVQEGTRAVRIEPRSPAPLRPGDLVEAVGYVDMSRAVAMIGGAEVRRLGVGRLTKPHTITPEEIMAINTDAVATGRAAQPHDFDGHVVRFRAHLLAVQSSPDDTASWRKLTMRQGGLILEAFLPEGRDTRWDALQVGSDLEVTGLVQLEYAAVEGKRGILQPVRLGVVLRSLADVVVMQAPSWWTAGRLLGVIAVGALTLGGSLLWVWQLRRQVQRKTHELSTAMRARRDAALEFQATLRERNRLAANLHDTLLQTIGGVGFQLEACEAAATVPRPNRTPLAHLDVARRMLDHAANELRSSVWTLRSLPLNGLTLPKVLEALAARTSDGHDVQISVCAEGDFSNLPDFVAGNLLLVAQESLHNAIKHAKPGHISIEVRPAEKSGWISLLVRDDGAGFTPGQQAGATQGHFGLAGIRERIERLEGILLVESAPRMGTTIRIEVPVRSYDGAVA